MMEPQYFKDQMLQLRSHNLSKDKLQGIHDKRIEECALLEASKLQATMTENPNR